MIDEISNNLDGIACVYVGKIIHEIYELPAIVKLKICHILTCSVFQRCNITGDFESIEKLVKDFGECILKHVQEEYKE